jgi:hypothetical protein
MAAAVAEWRDGRGARRWRPDRKDKALPVARLSDPVIAGVEDRKQRKTDQAGSDDP